MAPRYQGRRKRRWRPAPSRRRTRSTVRGHGPHDEAGRPRRGRGAGLRLAERTGFEPATFCVTGRYANRYTTAPDATPGYAAPGRVSTDANRARSITTRPTRPGRRSGWRRTPAARPPAPWRATQRVLDHEHGRHDHRRQVDGAEARRPAPAPPGRPRPRRARRRRCGGRPRRRSGRARCARRAPGRSRGRAWRTRRRSRRSTRRPPATATTPAGEGAGDGDPAAGGRGADRDAQPGVAPPREALRQRVERQEQRRHRQQRGRQRVERQARDHERDQPQPGQQPSRRRRRGRRWGSRAGRARVGGVDAGVEHPVDRHREGAGARHRQRHPAERGPGRGPPAASHMPA
jgi:hypothetical protein